MNAVMLTVAGKFGIAAVLALGAVVLAVGGMKAFYRGVGIQKLRDQTFLIEAPGFRMSGVVSSVGVLAILASCWFATNAMWSVPSTFKQTPDSLEFSGSTLSVPKTGELVRTVGGQEKQIEKVIKATRLPEGEITQGTPSGEVIQEYLDYARRTPGTGIYVDLAGKGKYPAGVEWGGMWAKAVMIEPDRLIVNPGSKLYGKGAPTISIIEMRDAGPAAAGGMKY